MRIQKTKKLKNHVVILAITGILATGMYIAAALQYSLWPFTTTSPANLSPPSPDEKKAGAQIKSNSVESSTKNNATRSGSDQPLPPVPTPGATTSTAIVDIISSTQDSSMYRVRVLIQAILGNGQCKLTMTKGSESYTADAEIQPSASTSTCTGFDIPISKLSTGTWSVVIDVSSGSIVGTARQEIEIK